MGTSASFSAGKLETENIIIHNRDFSESPLQREIIRSEWHCGVTVRFISSLLSSFISSSECFSSIVCFLSFSLSSSFLLCIFLSQLQTFSKDTEMVVTLRFRLKTITCRFPPPAKHDDTLQGGKLVSYTQSIQRHCFF